MLTDFQNSFTDGLSSKFLALNTPQRVQRVATLPREMFVLKNRHAPELSGEKCHAKLSHSK